MGLKKKTKINKKHRTTTFYILKYFEVGNILKYCCKEQFPLVSTIHVVVRFPCLNRDLILDKWLFEIGEVEIKRVDCILQCPKVLQMASKADLGLHCLISHRNPFHPLSNKYIEPSLQRQHLLPLKMLPLKRICCCKESLMARMVCKKDLV